MRFVLASVLQVLGLLLLAFGLYMLAPWVGVAVAGAGLVLLGFSVDPPARRKS